VQPRRRLFVIGIAAFTVVSRVATTFAPLYLMKQGLRASLLPALNLAQIIEKLRERLKPNGLLIVCRTDSVGVNHATVFESTRDSKFRVLLRLGGGSEVEGLMRERL